MTLTYWTSVETTNKMQPCNRIYYSKIYWGLNMFRAAYRSSSGAPNCICSLWFIYPCGDRPLSRLGGNSVPTQRPPGRQFPPIKCVMMIADITPWHLAAMVHQDGGLATADHVGVSHPYSTEPEQTQKAGKCHSRCPGWVGTQSPPSLDNGRSPHGYINQRLQIQFGAPYDEWCTARNMLSLQ